MATGFPTKANYATGDVLTAANMNDLSGTVNYLQYMPPRNPILNSAMNVWQRGTSISVAASSGLTYTADRWCIAATGASQAVTVSRQVTGDTTNLPNIQYCARVQRNSGQTGTGVLQFAQSMETVNSIPYSGKTVTVSFYARAGANYSSASNALSIALVSGTGTDQNLNGYTGGAAVLSGTPTLTTTWQRFSYTGTVSSSATELYFTSYYTPVGTAGANDYFEITGVQLELGSVANTYMPNQPTYQGELAACQRYYWRNTAYNPYSQYGIGAFQNTTQGYISIDLPVTMRIAPSSLDYSTTCVQVVITGLAISAVTALTLDQSGTKNCSLAFTVASGGTPNQSVRFLANNSTSSYIAFNAEL